MNDQKKNPEKNKIYSKLQENQKKQRIEDIPMYWTGKQIQGRTSLPWFDAPVVCVYIQREKCMYVYKICGGG